jgi:predicted transcriptional regulator
VIRSYTVQAGDGWLGIARSFEPAAADADVYAFARRIAVANGATFDTALYPDRILWLDDAWVPAPAPEPEPEPEPEPDATWEELFNAVPLDEAAITAWFQANTGHRAFDLLDMQGQQLTIDAAWLAANEAGPHVTQYEPGRWIVERVHCRNVRSMVDNVTVRDCLIDGQANGANLRGVVALEGQAGIVVEHCTLNGGGVVDRHLRLLPAGHRTESGDHPPL